MAPSSCGSSAAVDESVLAGDACGTVASAIGIAAAVRRRRRVVRCARVQVSDHEAAWLTLAEPAREAVGYGRTDALVEGVPKSVTKSVGVSRELRRGYRLRQPPHRTPTPPLKPRQSLHSNSERQSNLIAEHDGARSVRKFVHYA